MDNMDGGQMQIGVGKSDIDCTHGAKTSLDAGWIKGG